MLNLLRQQSILSTLQASIVGWVLAVSLLYPVTMQAEVANSDLLIKACEGYQGQDLKDCLVRESNFQLQVLRFSPDTLRPLALGTKLYAEFEYSITYPGQVYIFVEAEGISTGDAAYFASPSPKYGPGRSEGTGSVYLGFNREAQISGLVFVIADADSYLELARFHTSWQVSWAETGNESALSALASPAKSCSKTFVWPELASVLPASVCENTAVFDLNGGYTLKQRLDLDADGICELFVVSEHCRKAENICLLIFREHESGFREIYQYYNKLEFLEAYNGFPQLKSSEIDTQGTQIYRLGRYNGSRYEVTLISDDCSSL